MQPRRIVLLGSTGSIGTQAIDVVDGAPHLFEVVALAAAETWNCWPQVVHSGAAVVGIAGGDPARLESLIADAATAAAAGATPEIISARTLPHPDRCGSGGRGAQRHHRFHRTGTYPGGPAGRGHPGAGKQGVPDRGRQPGQSGGLGTARSFPWTSSIRRLPSVLPRSGTAGEVENPVPHRVRRSLPRPQPGCAP